MATYQSPTGVPKDDSHMLEADLIDGYRKSEKHENATIEPS